MAATTHVGAMLEANEVHHAYGEHVVIDGLTFSVTAGEFVSIVGPSGCGKTTLLRVLSGLQQSMGGTVRLLGNVVQDVPDALAMVFQDYSRSLFPWLTVGGNVDFPMRRMGLSKAERRARIAESLDAVDLRGVADKYPWQLSGGMQQRAAIARALAYRPEVLLMDEPFASVDAQTRMDLEDLILRVWSEYGMTILFVTHDIDESVYLSDRVLVLSISPATVLDDVAIRLPRPRDQIDTKATSLFVELRVRVASLIRASKNHPHTPPVQSPTREEDIPAIG